MNRIMIALAATALLGCSGDKTTGPAQDPAVGVYVLQTVNGSGLPYNAGTSGGVTVEILNDQYSINADGTYSEQGAFRLSQSGTTVTQQFVETGVWSRNGTALTLTITASSIGDAGSYSGALSGSTLTITQTGFVGVYRKS